VCFPVDGGFERRFRRVAFLFFYSVRSFLSVLCVSAFGFIRFKLVDDGEFGEVGGGVFDGAEDY
jgi:hypothetical protein